MNITYSRMTARGTVRTNSDFSPSLNTDAPELSRWEQSVEDWIDACPFTLYDCDRKELREMAEENTAPEGDE